MRVALVSPYSWTYPGGVGRHVEALSGELRARGHDVLVLAPGTGEGIVGLGGTVRLPFNGAVSPLALHPTAVSVLRRELRDFAPDVVHLHEPVVPVVCWDALMTAPAPLVGTFHTYGTNAWTHGFAALAGSHRRMRRLAVRIAVSEAAAWTGRRFYGGEYRVIPNGVHLRPPGRKQPGERLRVLFVGQGVARKGLPVIQRAMAAAPDAELTVIGADVPGSLGRVGEDRKWAELERADVLVAPSLGGESFGMVLVEAFAAGTPVIASDIPGYREVVGDAGVLVPPGDPEALAAALRGFDPAAFDPRGRAERYAWPQVAAQVERAYEDALTAPAARHVPRARRIPPLEPPRRRRRPLVAAGAALGLGAAAVGAGPDALAGSSPPWALLGLALMCASMVLRAVAWRSILRGALPHARFDDAMQGTAIGVLMSATLPARLGEPARALIVARRVGALPVVIGTMVGQTLLNVLALAILAAAVLPAVPLLREDGLAWYALAPLAVAALVVAVPARLRSGLAVFRDPPRALAAAGAQLGAWALQWLACWVLLVALGLGHRAGAGAAAAVLLAVNVTALVPLTPSNLGVFQAACVAVLAGAYDVRAADALAYGIVLQGVEVVTALVMGAPALVREGLSWREVRLSALQAARTGPSPAGAGRAAAAGAGGAAAVRRSPP